MNMVNHNLKEDRYSTSDTQLAAYIQTEGFELLEILPGQRAQFVFLNDSVKLQEQVRLFLAGKAKVEPSLYMRNYRTLARKAREGLPL